MNRLNIMVGILFILSMSGTHAKTMKMDVDASKPGFEVMLPANPTTGYTWKVLTFDKKLLSLQDETYVSHDSNLIGSGGMRVYTFNFVKRDNTIPLTTTIVFRYGRSWDDSTKKDTTVKIRFINIPLSPEQPAATQTNPNVMLPKPPEK